jgi:hypothetical protein
MELKLSGTKNYNSEIGYLVKSPCKDCGIREDLPECIQGCEILGQIQTILAHSIPSEKNISEFETYDVPTEVLEQISMQ